MIIIYLHRKKRNKAIIGIRNLHEKAKKILRSCSTKDKTPEELFN